MLSQTFKEDMTSLLPVHPYFPNLYYAYFDSNFYTNLWMGTEEKEFEYKGDTYRILKVSYEQKRLTLLRNPIT